MWWVLPSVVWGIVASHGQPHTLAEAAARAAQLRQMAPAVVRAVTDRDVPRAVVEVPLSVPAADASAAAGAATPPSAKAEEHDEKWWRDQMTTAKASLERDQVMAAGLQSRVNALATDIVNRDDPAQRAQLMDERQRALQELDSLQKQIGADGERIAAIEEDARVKGIPPGWIR
jgi:hypothetical protein